jgi:protein ImuB
VVSFAGGALRPLRLIQPPQPIEVLAELPEGPPERFRWRRVSRRVVCAEGPERIEPEWWRSAPGADPGPRDYYRLEDEKGCRYWVFRQGLYEGPTPPRWYVQGLFA